MTHTLMMCRNCRPVKLYQYVNDDSRLIFETQLVFEEIRYPSSQFSEFEKIVSKQTLLKIKQEHTKTQCCIIGLDHIIYKTRMWANDQGDGRPAEYRWRPLFNAAKFG